jgi:uncharacterized membrane protein
MERSERAAAAPARDLGGRKVVAGLFTEREAAVAAIDDLKGAGFSPDDVGIAMRDKGQQGDLAQETGAKAAEGAATGALGGGLLGGGTAVAGAGIGAAAGGLVGALVGLGIPEAEAKHFEEGFRAGGVLVTVTGGDRAPDALTILERHGADTGAGAGGAAA